MNEDPKTSLDPCKSDQGRRKTESMSRSRRSSGGKKSSTTDIRRQKSPSQATENGVTRSSTRRQGSDRDLGRRGKPRKSFQKQDDPISQSTHNPTRPKTRPALNRPKSVRSLATKATPSVSKKKDDPMSQSSHNPSRPKTRPALNRPKSVRSLATNDDGVDRSLRRRERVRKRTSSTQKAAASPSNKGDKPISRGASFPRSNSAPVSSQDYHGNSQGMLPYTLEPIESGNDQSDSEIDESSPPTRIPPASLVKHESLQMRQPRPAMVRPPSFKFEDDDRKSDSRSESSDDESGSSSSFSHSDVDKTMKSFNMSMESTSSSVSGNNMMQSYVAHTTTQQDASAATATSSKIFLGLQYLASSHLNDPSQSEASTLEGSEHQSEVSDSEFDRLRAPEDQERQEASPQKSDEQVALFGSSKSSGVNANTFDSKNNNNRGLSRSKGGKSARNLLREHSQKNLSKSETNDKEDRRSTSSLLKKAKSLRKMSTSSDTGNRVDRMLQYAESFRNLSNKAAEVKASSRKVVVKLSREVY